MCAGSPKFLESLYKQGAKSLQYFALGLDSGSFKHHVENEFVYLTCSFVDARRLRSGLLNLNNGLP